MIKKESIYFDYNNMMTDYVGDITGITDEDINSQKISAKKAFTKVAEGRGKNMMGWTELPYNQKDTVTEIVSTAKNFRQFCCFGNRRLGTRAYGTLSGTLPFTP